MKIIQDPLNIEALVDEDISSKTSCKSGYTYYEDCQDAATTRGAYITCNYGYSN